MIGAIIGDIAGSRFEGHFDKRKDFDLLDKECYFTDDTVLTLAVARALLDRGDGRRDLAERTVRALRAVGRPYPYCGWGDMFQEWLYSEMPEPYGSYGNGAASRVSPCAFAARNLGEAQTMARKVTEVTHDHPDALKGAEAVASCVFLARAGRGKDDVLTMAASYYCMDFTLDEIRPGFDFCQDCPGTVPPAIMAFIESDSFIDAIRNAVSLGGDTDTLAAITGALAEAHYGVPRSLRETALRFLDERLIRILLDFEEAYPSAVRGARSATGLTGADKL